MEKIEQSLTFRRGLTLKNRVIMAPMTTKMSFYDGVVTKNELDYYALRSGEVGAVITAAANVHPSGKGWEGELGIYDDIFLPGLTKLAQTIKQDGSKAIIQLFHAGRMTDSSVLRGEQPIAPSSIPAERPNAEVPREMSEQEILDLVDHFKAATLRAIQAGFDGIEIHGANTYLIQQFFSPHSNRREDKWGGSVEKRFTLIERLVDTLIETVDKSGAKDFIIGYRFSPEEFEEPGIRFEDTLYLVEQLSRKQLDYLHISLWHHARMSVSQQYQEKTLLAYVAEKINGRIPLIGVGDVRTKEDAEHVLAHADCVAVGRSLLIDPHWTQKILTHQDHLIHTEIKRTDYDSLCIENGLLEFLVNMMPERLVDHES